MLSGEYVQHLDPHRSERSVTLLQSNETDLCGVQTEQRGCPFADFIAPRGCEPQRGQRRLCDRRMVDG